MALILNLETATTNCSVSLVKNGEIISFKEENSKSYIHSEKLHVFIDEAIKKSGFSLTDLDAIAISKGPGSYTGLRIGVSAAKGLCFSLDVPLIAIATLESLANQIRAKEDEVLIPLLDARRMEVYSAVFDENHQQIRETKAEVIDKNSFSEFNSKRKVHLVGSGAEKCDGVVVGNHFKIHSTNYPSSKEMATLSFKKFKESDFEDVAYFEPYYLKDFVLGGKKSTTT